MNNQINHQTFLASAETPCYTVLDLFSGIGGFSLGLERTGGFKTVAFCEIDQFCRKVLAKHWPTVPCYHDIREVNNATADVICGGFPCQDISTAGKQVGLAGERSGLWFEMRRVIDEGKPEWVIVENVANLRSKGLATVLHDLWEIGYDAEWHVIPACAVGAPHKRERLWVIANRDGLRVERARVELKTTGINKRPWCDWPGTQPRAMRMDDGFSAEVHRNRIKQLGNSVIPQIVEAIGRSILAV